MTITGDSILHEFNALRNDGRASVNNTGNRDIKDREKEWVDVKWNPTITLPQLRSLVDMMNNMLLIPAKKKEFIMGKATGKGYDSPQHTVVLSSDYYMCKYEVTRSLWYAVISD